jgi:hypothetical protein
LNIPDGIFIINPSHTSLGIIDIELLEILVKTYSIDLCETTLDNTAIDNKIFLTNMGQSELLTGFKYKKSYDSTIMGIEILPFLDETITHPSLRSPLYCISTFIIDNLLLSVI